MKRCVIIAAYNPYGIRSTIDITDNDFVICADGGYNLAEAEGIFPDVVIGDFDSISCENVRAGEIIRVAAEKDDTDTMLCLKYGIRRGYDDIVIVGGIGGRFDHSIANVQTMSYACGFINKIRISNAETNMYMISNCELRLKRPDECRYISLFSVSDECKGVSITGAKYPLTDAVLTSDFPLGVSNEFAEDEICIKVKSGKLLIVIENQS